ncbi:MAG: biotin transporter BioY [Planctomycetes bacterium]|nr:biotin transporter BioY [Planctomycetota bacterium]
MNSVHVQAEHCAVEAWEAGVVRSLDGIGGIVGCAVLLGLAAQVRIPLMGTPVPATLQLLAVLLAGYSLRPSRAAAGVVLYVAAGTLGLPVFAGGSAGLWGVTGGYIAGFVVAAWSISWLGGRSDASYVRLLVAGAVGTGIVFVFGLAWPLAFFVRDLATVVHMGLVPFAVKAVVEIFLAVTLVVTGRGLGRRWSMARAL